MNTLHRAVVAGATGSIGRHCICLLVRDPRVESVTALTRSGDKDASFYGLNPSADPITKLKHLQIDFNKDIDQQFSNANADFTIGLSGLGVYTADVKDVEDFMNREYTPNINLAKAAATRGVKNWAYLSGKGVAMNESKGTFQPLFSWVKGCIERDISRIEELDYVSTFRPGGIVGRPLDKSQPGIAGWLEKQMTKYQDRLRNTNGFVHRDDISKAMVHSILTKDNNDGKYKEANKYNITIFENEDIKIKSKQYDSEFRSN